MDNIYEKYARSRHTFSGNRFRIRIHSHAILFVLLRAILKSTVLMELELANSSLFPFISRGHYVICELIHLPELPLCN